MSNKKNLLNETQIRQFMKLASLQPLTPGFVQGLTEKTEAKGGEGYKQRLSQHLGPDTGKGEASKEEREHESEGEEEAHGKGKFSGDPGMSEGKDEELEEAVEELDESPGRGANEYNKPGHHRGGGVKGGGEPAPGVKESMEYRDEDEELESELHATEDELGDEDSLADEEGAELDDVDMGGETETSLTIRQVVSAIEAALEELLPNEEVDAEYVGDDDMDVEAEEEFAPEGDEVVADIEVGDEEALEEFNVPVVGKAARDARAKKKKDIEDLDVSSDVRTAFDKKTGGSGATRTRSPRGANTYGLGGAYGSVTEGSTDDLVEQITKRVAARILKSALAKK
jgi:hypothetical protein